MAARQCQSARLRNKFIDDVESLERLFSSVQTMKPSSKYASRPISWRQAAELMEGVYMKLFVRWEDYQESLFLAYLIGKDTPNGTNVKRHFFPLDSDHARRAYLDRRGFSDWTAPDQVLERADLLLQNGGPFRNAIAPHLAELRELKILRNAIAHHSGPARKKFESLVRNTISYLPSGTSPGAFLISLAPHSTEIQWERYVKLIKDVGSDLAP